MIVPNNIYIAQDKKAENIYINKDKTKQVPKTKIVCVFGGRSW